MQCDGVKGALQPVRVSFLGKELRQLREGWSSGCGSCRKGRRLGRATQLGGRQDPTGWTVLPVSPATALTVDAYHLAPP